MKDPIPESALPYNTVPRPKPKKWLLWTAPKDVEGFYSPFLPLAIVFFALIILLVYEVSFLRYRTVNLRTQNLRLAAGVQQANIQLTFAQGLHADLQALAPHDPAAEAILKEFFPAETSTPNSAESASSPVSSPDSPAK